jgi:uncharacterized protein DUF5989
LQEAGGRTIVEERIRMSDPSNQVQTSQAPSGILSRLWQQKAWWLWPLVVLLLLIGIIYVLGHLSSADPEMYPTTLLRSGIRMTLC